MSATGKSQLLLLHREMAKHPNNSEKMRKALSNARNIRYAAYDQPPVGMRWSFTATNRRTMYLTRSGSFETLRTRTK